MCKWTIAVKSAMRFSIDVLFEFHLKFWTPASIGIPVRSLLLDRLLTCLTAQQKGTTARWNSNKSLYVFHLIKICDRDF